MGNFNLFLRRTFLTLGVLLFSIGIPISVYVVNNIDNLDDRSRADDQTVLLEVYPDSGNCEEFPNPSSIRCFEGGNGIQDAIDYIPEDDSNYEIKINSGTYSRNSSERMPYNEVNGVDCTYYNKEKSFDLVGVDKESVILDGSNQNTSGICIKDGNVNIKGMIIKNFKNSGIEMETGSSGRIISNIIKKNDYGGIKLNSVNNVDIIGNIIAENSYWNGILLQGANIKVSNNVIKANENHGIKVLGTIKNIEILNNEIIGNEDNGINLSINGTKDIILRNNNIVANRNGAGIFNKYDFSVEGKISHNTIWFNNGRPSDDVYDENADYFECTGKEICDFEGVVRAKPKYVADWEDDYHLKPDSPAIDSGYGVDPDGTQADIGIYGGEYACIWEDNDNCTCDGKDCGIDGYGNSCGDCGNLVCLNNQCVNCREDKDDCDKDEVCINGICEVESTCRTPIDNKEGIGECCDPYKEVNVYSNPPACNPLFCGHICLDINCGDGLCRNYENECYCPEDCGNSKCLKADLNCDGFISMADYTEFVVDYMDHKKLISLCGDPIQGVYRYRSDLNEDSDISMADYTEFVEIYTNNTDTGLKDTCENIGGKWIEKSEEIDKARCSYPTEDAGNSCTDSSECESYCLAPEDSKVGDKVNGSCAEYTFLDCAKEVENGQVISEWCI